MKIKNYGRESGAPSQCPPPSRRTLVVVGLARGPLGVAGVGRAGGGGGVRQGQGALRVAVAVEVAEGQDHVHRLGQREREREIAKGHCTDEQELEEANTYSRVKYGLY